MLDNTAFIAFKSQVKLFKKSFTSEWKQWQRTAPY